MHKTKHFEALDGLRGVAAFAVAFSHAIDTCFPNSGLLQSSHLAVDFFFCLSGLVVAHAYEVRLKTGMSFANFARERLIRLWPLAFLGALIGGVALIGREIAFHELNLPRAVAAIALNLAILPSMTLTDGAQAEIFAFATNGPLWSLFWELVINFAFALVVLHLTTRRLVILIAAGSILTVRGAWTHGSLDFGWSPQDLQLGAVRVLFPFCCGVLLHRWPLRSNTWAFPAALVLAGILFSPRLGGSADAFIVLLVFPLLIWLSAGSAVGPRTASVCDWLGRISYPIYVLHLPIIRLVAYAARHHDLAPQLVPLVAMPVALVIAEVASRVDARFRDWLKQIVPHGAPKLVVRPLSEAGSASG
jgi:peptidoglycan/LPS O-acetylase OafA/YrhL